MELRKSRSRSRNSCPQAWIQAYIYSLRKRNPVFLSAAAGLRISLPQFGGACGTNEERNLRVRYLNYPAMRRKPAMRKEVAGIKERELRPATERSCAVPAYAVNAGLPAAFESAPGVCPVPWPLPRCTFARVESRPAPCRAGRCASRPSQAGNVQPSHPSSAGLL